MVITVNRRLNLYEVPKVHNSDYRTYRPTETFSQETEFHLFLGTVYMEGGRS